jgi:hypothetical protein
MEFCSSTSLGYEIGLKLEHGTPQFGYPRKILMKCNIVFSVKCILLIIDGDYFDVSE